MYTPKDKKAYRKLLRASICRRY